MRMSDCVEGGRGDDSRGVGAVEAQSMEGALQVGPCIEGRRTARSPRSISV